MTDDPIPEIKADDVADDTLAEFSPDIFQNQKLLSPNHVPDLSRIVGRDEELTKLESAVKPAAHGHPPRDAVIISKPGTGKTLCAKNVAGRVRAVADTTGTELVATYVNCGDDSTETQVAYRLLKSACHSLGEDGLLAPTGISTQRYFEALWDVLEQADALLVILDEADKLGGGANDVIKRLADAQSDGKAPNTGIIAISNLLSFYDSLEPEVQSRMTMNDTETIFEPYDATQLRKILNHRDDAFHDGVVEDGVIPLCAALAAQEHGDARKALDLLLAAGEHAERRDAEQVTDADVEAVHEKAETMREREMIRTSVDHAQYALFALAYLSKTKLPNEFSTGDIEQTYTEVCQHAGVDPQTSRRLLAHLKKWAKVEITEHQHTGGGKGKGSFRKHRLLLDPDVVIEVVQQQTLHADVVAEL